MASLEDYISKCMKQARLQIYNTRRHDIPAFILESMAQKEWCANLTIPEPKLTPNERIIAEICQNICLAHNNKFRNMDRAFRFMNKAKYIWTKDLNCPEPMFTEDQIWHMRLFKMELEIKKARDNINGG